MKFAFWLTAFSLSTSTLADVIDLGNLDQYKPKIDKVPPELDQNGLWVSRGQGGTTFIPGKQVSKNIHDAVNNCQVFDGGCYNDVSKASKGLWVQTDPQLESRQLPAIGIAAGAVALFLGVGGPHLFNSGKGKGVEVVEHGVFVPDKQASSFSVMTPGATVTLSGGGSAIATITQPAAPTSIQASATPAVSIVTEAKDGFEKGDLKVQLDTDLANKLNDYIQVVKDTTCKDGEAFQQSEKRASASVSPQVFCATEDVIKQAGADGIFSGLMVMDVSKVHIDLTDAIAKGKEAVVALSDFIKAYSPLLAIPLPEAADQVAIVTLLMIYDALVENNPISANHRVKAKLFEVDEEGSETEVTTTSSGGCPKPTELPCGMKNERCGREDKEEGDRVKSVCKDGDHKDCECSILGYTFINQVPEAFAKALADFLNVIGNGESTESAPPDSTGLKCDIARSGFPSELFHSEKNSIAKQYCEFWNKDFRATVNAKGEIQGPRLRGRTPPTKLTDMSDWRVDLEFKKAENGGECSLGCDDAFKAIVNKCTANSGGSFIYKDGNFDLKCGTLTWKVYDMTKPREPEKQPPKEPACGEAPSKFPAAMFSAEGNKLYEEFCTAWRKGETSAMVVDSKGQKTDPGKKSPETDGYSSWRANFDFWSDPNGGECTMGCREAFDKIASTCQKDSWQYRQGSVEAGCGIYRYHVYVGEYDWDGAGLCSTMWLDHCKDSIYHVDPNKLYSTDGEEGNCRGNGAGYGCGTFLQGPHCEAYGFELINYYEALRGNGADKCGSVHLGDGCLFTVNRVTGCKHRYKEDA